MAIIIPENYHIQKALQERRVHCITPGRAEHQDIRPLRIGILNIMPQAESYEFNILFPLGRSIIQIEPVWLRLKTHTYRSSNKEHLDTFYHTFEEAIKHRGFDGIIVTGAPVEEIPFEEVTYWNEFTEILDYAHEHVASTLGICWGGLALAKYMGIEKVQYPDKLFGIYPLHNLDRSNRITGDLDDLFWCPQSRHSGIPDSVLKRKEQEGVVKLLAHSKETGYVIFESADEKFIMHLGHAEYRTQRLIEEYRRDMARGRADVSPPVNLDIENPQNIWRSSSQEFFLQWIKRVYLDTPYEI